MSAGFWKRNEKVVMTLLLLILAPTFAATGAMFFFFGERQVLRSDAMEVYGNTLTVQDRTIAQKELREISQVMAKRSYGPFYRQQTLMTLEDYIVLRGMADRLGRQHPFWVCAHHHSRVCGPYYGWTGRFNGVYPHHEGPLAMV